MASTILEMAESGQVNLPKTLCDENKWGVGQQLTMIDLGDGVVILSSKVSKIDSMLDKLRDELLDDGATLEGMLAEIRHHREAGVD